VNPSSPNKQFESLKYVFRESIDEPTKEISKETWLSILGCIDLCVLSSIESRLEFVTQICLATRSNATADAMKFVGIIASLCAVESGAAPVVVESIDIGNDILLCCRKDEDNNHIHVIPSKKAQVYSLYVYVYIALASYPKIPCDYLEQIQTQV
jgi:hypothetical protein